MEININDIFIKNDKIPQQNTSSASRGSIIDKVEACKKIQAQISHLQENLTSYGTNENINIDDRDTAILEIERLLRMRRGYMNHIKNQFDTNPHYWCATKHAMEIAQFAEEVWQSDILDEELFQYFIEANEHLYTILSMWLNTPKIVACGRCFNDMMTEEGAKMLDILGKTNKMNE